MPYRPNQIGQYPRVHLDKGLKVKASVTPSYFEVVIGNPKVGFIDTIPTSRETDSQTVFLNTFTANSGKCYGFGIGLIRPEDLSQAYIYDVHGFMSFYYTSADNQVIKNYPMIGLGHGNGSVTAPTSISGSVVPSDLAFRQENNQTYVTCNFSTSILGTTTASIANSEDGANVNPVFLAHIIENYSANNVVFSNMTYSLSISRYINDINTYNPNG